MICHAQSYYEEDRRLFRGLLTIGLNLTQIDGDGPSGYNYVGFTGGVGTLVQWHKNVSTSLEILYSQRGSIQKGVLKQGLEEKFKIHTDYVEMPICFNVNDDKIFIAGIGISPAILTTYNINYESRDIITGAINTTPTSCLLTPMKEYDLSGLVKIQFNVFKTISVGGKYNYSLLSLRPPCEGATKANGQYHNDISFYIHYKL